MVDDGDNYVMGFDYVKVKTVAFIYSALPEVVETLVFFGVEGRVSTVHQQVFELLIDFLLYRRGECAILFDGFASKSNPHNTLVFYEVLWYYQTR